VFEPHGEKRKGGKGGGERFLPSAAVGGGKGLNENGV